MKQNLFQEINEQSKILKDLCETLGVKKEDIPQELLDEIFGVSPEPEGISAARGRSQDTAYASDLSQQQSRQKEYTPRAAPRDVPPGTEPVTPQMGDFIKIGNGFAKVKKVFDQFNNTFVLHTGGDKPIMASNLKLDKEVGGKRIFVPTV